MLADRDEEARLSEAAKVSMETNQMTPLIKEELRLSIMKKRHDSGQEQIKVEFPEPKEYELTSYEKMKRERRREQNRRAAQRCRQKKKSQQCGKQEVFSTIITQNTKLQAEVKKLRKEKNSLGACLKEHIMSGCCRQGKLDDALNFLQPPVAPNPVIPPVHPRYPNQLQDAQALPVTTAYQADGALPSFADTFLESVSPTEVDEGVFQFYSDMRTDRLSTRTWSGTSDDVTPSDSLPEIIFDAMDPTDDVFYDNDQLPTKMESGTIHQALQDASILNQAEDVWAHQDLINALCRDPNFDPDLPNEP